LADRGLAVYGMLEYLPDPFPCRAVGAHPLVSVPDSLGHCVREYWHWRTLCCGGEVRGRAHVGVEGAVTKVLSLMMRSIRVSRRLLSGWPNILGSSVWHLLRYTPVTWHGTIRIFLCASPLSLFVCLCRSTVSPSTRMVVIVRGANGNRVSGPAVREPWIGPAPPLSFILFVGLGRLRLVYPVLSALLYCTRCSALAVLDRKRDLELLSHTCARKKRLNLPLHGDNNSRICIAIDPLRHSARRRGQSS